MIIEEDQNSSPEFEIFKAPRLNGAAAGSCA